MQCWQRWLKMIDLSMTQEQQLDTAIEALKEIVDMMRELNDGMMEAMGIKNQ